MAGPSPPKGIRVLEIMRRLLQHQTHSLNAAGWRRTTLRGASRVLTAYRTIIKYL